MVIGIIIFALSRLRSQKIGYVSSILKLRFLSVPRRSYHKQSTSSFFLYLPVMKELICFREGREYKTSVCALLTGRVTEEWCSLNVTDTFPVGNTGEVSRATHEDRTNNAQ